MRITADAIIAVILLFFCAFAAYLTQDVPDIGMGAKLGPSFFPTLSISLIAFLSTILLIRTIIAKNVEAYARLSSGILTKMALFLLLMFVYATFYLTIGWIFSAGAFFIIAMLALGERRLIHVVVIPAGIILLVFFLFTELMQVYLP